MDATARRRRLLMTVLGGGVPPDKAFSNYINSLSGLVGSWPFQDAAASGTAIANPTSMNGTNSNVTTGVSSGNAAFPLCYTFNGTTSFVNYFSAAFSAAFNGPLGSVFCLMRVSSAGIWTDGLNHTCIYFATDAGYTNAIVLGKSAANNILDDRYYAGTTLSNRLPVIGPLNGWVMIGTTWNKAGDQKQDYVNGVATGAVVTGLGTWSAQPVATRTMFGAQNTIAAPQTVWSGNMAYPTFFNRVLTPTEWLTLAQLAGLA